LTVPIGEESVESFHMHREEIRRRRTRRERGQPQRPGPDRGWRFQQNADIESRGDC
jgi:hypothetical protein